MNNDIDLKRQLADVIRAKANATVKSKLTPIEWGKIYTPHFFFRSFCDFHIDMSNTLHDMTYHRGSKIVVVAPRGNAKSTICSMLAPLKAVCEGTEKYILLISDTGDQAKKYLKTIADELKYNEALKEKYPHACKEGDIWNADHIETASGVCVEAIGKGASVRGRKFKQYRPTLIILDDPQGDDDIQSPSTREKDMAWFDKALVPSGDTDTNFFVIGTNLHKECIVNVLLPRPDFKAMHYASIIEWPTNMELWGEWETKYIHGSKEEAQDYYNENKEMMHEGAKVLWPEKESLLDLMILRANIGHVAFACEKQNNPRDPSKAEFDEDWFVDTDYDQLPLDVPLVTVGYTDPASGGQTKRHDYSATILLHYSPTERCCYVTADIKKRPISQLIDDIIRLAKVYKPITFGVETNGFQHLIGEEAIAKYQLLPLVAMPNFGTHKNVRISRLAVWLQRKFFRFKRNCKDTKILLQQLLEHPHAAHDDGSDALEGALRALTDVCNLEDASLEPEDDQVGDNIFDNNAVLGMDW